MKFRKLFPVLPEDLAALGNEALADLLAAFRAVSAKLAANELDLMEALGAPEGTPVGEVSAEAMAQWQAAAEDVKAIKALQAERKAGEQAFTEAAAELHAEFEDAEADAVAAEVTEETVEAAADEDAEATADAEPLAAADDDEEDDEPEEQDEEPDAEASAEVEAVTAGAAPAKVTPVFPSVGRRYATPKAESSSDVVPLVAAGGNGAARIVPGEELDWLGYGEAVVKVARSRGPVTKVRGGGREHILIASAQARFPEELTLHPGDMEGNKRKLDALPGAGRGREAFKALVAAGGICAPPEPIYTLPFFGTFDRPVRDFLGTYNAPRGGVSIPGVTTIADYADAETDGGITIIEADEDALGGTFATKSCADMTCAEWTDVQVGIVSHCREFGNLNAITWPEGVAHENDNTMLLLARSAEGRLLKQMDALSLAVTGVATYGASATLLYNLVLAKNNIISTLRLDPATRVNVLLAFWVADMFAMDLQHGALGGSDGRFDTATNAAQVAALFARYGIDVTWHLDEDPAGTDEVWPAEVASSTINDWPGTTVIARMSLPNTFIRLDTGELELGLVRDSDLNHLNNYELFGELFEGVGRIGPLQATRRIAITVCPDGTISAPDTSPFTCNAS